MACGDLYHLKIGGTNANGIKGTQCVGLCHQTTHLLGEQERAHLVVLLERISICIYVIWR